MRTIVLALNVREGEDWASRNVSGDYLVVTPRSLDRVRGYTAQTLAWTPAGWALNRVTRHKMLDAVSPSFMVAR
jgi:hypothetical protein